MKSLRKKVAGRPVGGALLTAVLVLALAITTISEAGAQWSNPDPISHVPREQRRAARRQRAENRANAYTQRQLRLGKTPSFSRLEKSTNHALMYTEGLRYYNTPKKGKEQTSIFNLRRAQTLFTQAYRSQKFAGTPQEDSLSYFMGCSFFMAQDFGTSEQIFDNFRRQFGASPFVEDAEYKYAMGFYFQSPEPERDQTVTMRAIAAILEYMGRYPQTTHREVCEERMLDLRRKLYTKSYENARLYYDIGQYRAAVTALNNAIDLYPESPFREELMYLATRSAWLFARNSVTAQMTDRYLSMMDNYFNLISEYPATAHLREVERMRDEAQAYIESQTGSADRPDETDQVPDAATPATPAAPATQPTTTTTIR